MGWSPMMIGMYFWSNNIGRCTAIAQGETILKPALKIQPSRKTLLAESTNTFFASGGTGTLTWAFVKNPSGGTIPATYPTSMVYRAGTISSCIDVLEAWDVEDRLGRAYVNVIGAEEVARAGKAIIVAGRKSASDSLWPTTDYLADLAFNTLLYRGYSKTNIQYLSPVTNQDVDGNGQADDHRSGDDLGQCGLDVHELGDPTRTGCLCTWWIMEGILRGRATSGSTNRRG